MNYLRALILLISAALFGLSPAFAQMQGNGFQNGTPITPGISGTNPTFGLYFGGSNSARVGISGHLETGVPSVGTIPVLSACGGVTAPDAGSTDTAGTVTQGGTVTTCTITFGSPFTVKPACVVSDLTGTRASMASVASPTAITITGITASDALAWICVAKSGG